MGATGAGKTTLLDVLAGRKTSGYITGDIRISGFPEVQETFARVSGYCEQADVHSPQITVEESVVFSAWLRLPDSIDSDTKKEFVNHVLETIDCSQYEEKVKEMKQEFGQTCDWIKKRLGDKVASVQISHRLSASPCVLVSGKFGWSANMERLMKAQQMGDASSLEFMRSRRVFEVNPEHSIIKSLHAASSSSPEDEEALRAVDLLYDTALISSGYTLDNPSQLGGKISV